MRVVDEVIDLSMPFYEGMPCDDLGPKIWERLGYAYSRQLYQHTQSRAGRVFLTTDHTGTHLDGPLRFDPKGRPIEQIPLDDFIRPARQIDLRGIGRNGMIDVNALAAAGGGSLQAGDAAVLWTEHDLYVKDPDYFWHRPQLTEDGADYLVSRKVSIVAADFPGIGRPSDDRYVVKRILHRGGCMTVEQLRNLGAVAGKTWHLFCGPLRIRGTAGSIIRACALVNWRAKKVVDMTHEFFIGMPTMGAGTDLLDARQSQAHLDVLQGRIVVPDALAVPDRACGDAFRRALSFQRVWARYPRLHARRAVRTGENVGHDAQEADGADGTGGLRSRREARQRLHSAWRRRGRLDWARQELSHAQGLQQLPAVHHRRRCEVARFA